MIKLERLVTDAGLLFHKDLQGVLVEIHNPNWETGGRVHNWKTYIFDSIRLQWSALPLEAKVIAFIMAEQQASCEEWE